MYTPLGATGCYLSRFGSGSEGAPVKSSKAFLFHLAWPGFRQMDLQRRTPVAVAT